MMNDITRPARAGSCRSTLARLIVPAILSMGLGFTPAHADTYPDRAVTLVNPYAAGGPVDALARMFAKFLESELKQPIVVLNKAGASASIGSSFVARSKPDGYTLLMGTAAAHYITPSLTQTNYDGLADFTFVGMVDNASNLLVVNPQRVQVKTLKEFVDLAKSMPGKLNYGTAGVGTSNHVGMEMFQQRAGIQLTHIPYKGAGPALNDLIAGQVEVGLINMAGAMPLVKSGQLQPIAYAARERADSLPDVPTFSEAGYPGFTSGSWHSLAVPAGTPKPVVDRLAGALAAIHALPEFKQGLESLGVEPFVLGPDETTKLVHDEAKNILAMFKNTGMKLQ